MTRFSILQIVALLAIGTISQPAQAAAQTPPALPSPLSLGDVIRLASERRDEIQAAAHPPQGWVAYGSPRCGVRMQKSPLHIRIAVGGARLGRDEVWTLCCSEQPEDGLPDRVIHGGKALNGRGSSAV